MMADTAAAVKRYGNIIGSGIEAPRTDATLGTKNSPAMKIKLIRRIVK